MKTSFPEGSHCFLAMKLVYLGVADQEGSGGQRVGREEFAQLGKDFLSNIDGIAARLQLDRNDLHGIRSGEAQLSSPDGGPLQQISNQIYAKTIFFRPQRTDLHHVEGNPENQTIPCSSFRHQWLSVQYLKLGDQVGSLCPSQVIKRIHQWHLQEIQSRENRMAGSQGFNLPDSAELPIPGVKNGKGKDA